MLNIKQTPQSIPHKTLTEENRPFLVRSKKARAQLCPPFFSKGILFPCSEPSRRAQLPALPALSEVEGSKVEGLYFPLSTFNSLAQLSSPLGLFPGNFIYLYFQLSTFNPLAKLPR